MGGYEMDLLGWVKATVKMVMKLPNTQNTGSS